MKKFDWFKVNMASFDFFFIMFTNVQTVRGMHAVQVGVCVVRVRVCLCVPKSLVSAKKGEKDIYLSARTRMRTHARTRTDRQTDTPLESPKAAATGVRHAIALHCIGL